jgi:UDP-N-acetyl-D-mannosaminuronate dehydrogenase
MAHFPKAGWSGGFCLPKDTGYLEEWCNTLAEPLLDMNNVIFPFILAQQIQDAIKEGKTVGILGLSAMKDVDDDRGSLAEKLFPLLADIPLAWHDPFLPNSDSIGDVLACDVIVIGIPHSIYSPLDLSSKQLIDPWGVYA